MLSKICRYYKNIRDTYQNDLKFDVNLAKTRKIRNIKAICGKFFRIDISKENKKIEKIIQDYLEKELNNTVVEYAHDTNTGIYQKGAPIWVCWWQGLNGAPELVQKCVKSIEKNSGNHEVHVITQDNYTKYIDIPQYILDKVESKQMCFANFSDYIRVSLLEKWGGIWLDATIYVAQQIPEKYFDEDFYTCNAPSVNGYLSNGRWTSFCIGGWKNHVIFRYMKKAFERYWYNHDTSIDYLLVDYLMDLGYRNILKFKDSVDKVPINNLHRNDLSSAMVEGLPAEFFSRCINEDTVFYKLSWREEYSLKIGDGRDIVYAEFLKMDI